MKDLTPIPYETFEEKYSFIVGLEHGMAFMIWSVLDNCRSLKETARVCGMEEPAVQIWADKLQAKLDGDKVVGWEEGELWATQMKP